MSGFRTRQWVLWLLGLALLIGLVWLLRTILLPFLAGMAVAYFLDPVCDRMERWGLSRTIATSLLTVAFVVLVVAVFAVLLPLAVHQLGDLADSAPKMLAMARDRISSLLGRLDRIVDPETANQIRDSLAGSFGGVGSWLGSALGGVLSSSLALLNILSLVFLTPVVAFFMLRDWDRFVATVDSWIPRPHVAVVRTLARQIDETLAAWVRGVALVCILLSAFYAVTLTLLGLKVGLFVGLVAGMLSFVPFVGAIGGFILSVGMAALEFDSTWRIVAVGAVFVIGHVAEGNWLTPTLVGEKVDLHPVVMIFAFLAAGVLFGFVGLLLAVPAAAVIGVLARYAIDRYLRSPAYRGVDLPPPV